MCYSLILNNGVTKPHALKTFLDGLAELGIDKGLIKNKKVVKWKKEKGYKNVENTSDNESKKEAVFRSLGLVYFSRRWELDRVTIEMKHSNNF